jgi:hypothetical protein
MKKFRTVGALLLASLSSAALGLFLLTSASSAQQSTEIQQSREVLSRVYTIDKKYRSMVGPQSTDTTTLLDGQPAAHAARAVQGPRRPGGTATTEVD